MSYQRRRIAPRQLAGDMAHGPAWYRAMGGASTQLRTPRVTTQVYLGSLGDTATGGTTLSDPTVADPNVQWQASVLARLDAGVATLQRAELQKWLQILATISIPLSAAIWKAVFRRGAGVGDPTT